MLSSLRGRRAAALTLVAAVAVAACARWAQVPRFGSLPRDERPLDFEHNIELLEVSNGMRVALIQDNRTNLATVDMRYDVGAAEDPVGRAGLAHLVEHLMFELRAKPGAPTLGEELGTIALYQNASTTWDATHYTATLPIEQLDAAIAIEGRRMRATCDQLDEPTFLRERDVVLAEEAERRTPLGEQLLQILGEVYGPDHPYARPPGTREVASATRAEACAFIEQHYAPDRAVLVVTGRFDKAKVQALIGRSFGASTRKAGPRRRVSLAQPQGERTRHVGAVDRPTALVFFRMPPWGSDVSYRVARYRLGVALAAAGDERDWIVGTGVYELGGPRAPVLVAEVTVTSPDRLDAAADEVFARAARMFEGVTPRALGRMLGALELELVARWDDLAGRGSWIADFLQYTDHHWFMLKEMRELAETDWNQAAVALREQLVPVRAHVALLTPAGEGEASAVAAAVPTGSHALAPWRAPVDVAEADRRLDLKTVHDDLIERYQLANGLMVELAPDPRSPIVDARLVFPVGGAHEPADRPHLAYAAAAMLNQDIEGYYSAVDLDKLTWSTSRGTDLDSEVTETTTTFSARGMAHWADWHVWYLSWLLDQGRYNESDLDRMHRAARAASRDADDDEIDRHGLAFLARLFGAGHPYAVPPPGRGAAFLRLGAGDLERWKRDHYRARGATLIVSGDFDLRQMKHEIDELFGPWSGAPPADLPMIPRAHPARGPSWLAADDAEANQAGLAIGFATTSDPVRDRAARLVLSEMIEDEVREVREGMGASYGVHVSYSSGAAGGALLVHGQLDEGHAGEATRRVLAALARLRDDAAGARAAFVRARRKALGLALARAGGASAVADQLVWLAGQDLPLAYPARLAAQIATLTPAQLAAVAAADLAEARMVVQVRGKPAVVDATFAALGVTPER